MLVDHLLKTKKEHKNLKKQKIQDIFIKTNYRDLHRRTTSDKLICYKAFNIAKKNF